MKSSEIERDAYLRAEVTTHIASQIRSIRMQRGLSQRELAEKMGNKQATISRIEDPSYGKLSINTLLDVCKALDIGLQVRLTSFITMFHETYRVKPQEYIPTFEEEAETVEFFTSLARSESGVIPSTNYQIEQKTISSKRASTASLIEFTQPLRVASYIYGNEEFVHVD